MFLPMIRAMLALNPELRGNPFQGFHSAFPGGAILRTLDTSEVWQSG